MDDAEFEKNEINASDKHCPRVAPAGLVDFSNIKEALIGDKQGK